MVESCKDLKPWRADIKLFAFNNVPSCWDKSLPMEVVLEFLFPRPKSHYTAKGVLKNKAERYYTLSKNDVDKLCRAVLDSITSVVYNDDGQVVRLVANRRYCINGESEGVSVTIIPKYDVFLS